MSYPNAYQPLKDAVAGFPRTETKISPEQLECGIAFEVKRIKKDSAWVDRVLAKRYAMANLVMDADFYSANSKSRFRAYFAVFGLKS